MALPVLLGATAPALPRSAPEGALFWRAASAADTPALVWQAYRGLLGGLHASERFFVDDQDDPAPENDLHYLLADMNGDRRPEVFLQIQNSGQCFRGCITYVMTLIAGRWRNVCWFEGNNIRPGFGYTGIVPGRMRRNGWRDFAWYEMGGDEPWLITHRYTWRRHPPRHRDAGCVSQERAD
ncbi:MAG: hypothetical protein K2X74_22075 [Acetobacteraceae bacterium]|nr:hypothetical protein [Acetobacteraceae bacterium]